MEYLTERLSVYVIPPLLSIILGWSLSAVSVIRGRFRTENILFSMICIWWTLMPLIFLSHHLFRGNIDLIMKIERFFHFLYVYMPAIILLYLQKSFELNKRNLVIASFILSFIISVFVPTGYYISGLYTYSWGYSAKGEIVFKIFGVSAFLHLIYGTWFFIRRIKCASNYTERLKLKYILLSFIASAVLMIFNLPAINGIDFYAYGNFMFIPLALIAYGVLRYRLMDIKSVLHVSFIWSILSSLILVPNLLIFSFFRPMIYEISELSTFTFLVAWFFVNYYYFKKIKPVIDRVFNKQKINLIKAGSDFTENISNLKTLDSLKNLFTSALINNLHFKDVRFFGRIDDSMAFAGAEGEIFEIELPLYNWFVNDDRYIEHDMMKTNPYYMTIAGRITEIYSRSGCTYIIPLVRNNEVIAIVLAGERSNLRNLNRHESFFLENIQRSMAISVSNSVMYQKLSDLKDNLEYKVEMRTEELLKAKENAESANEELKAANDELSETRRISEIDMQMAAHVQKSIFPVIPDNIPGWDIAAAFLPMSMVSGDLYDFYIRDDELKGMILLDVSGHGIASGLITMIAKSVFYRNFFTHEKLTLGKIVEHANAELISEMGNTDKYLTGVIIRFDGDTVEYVNAGHPDMMFKKKNDGQVRIINPSEKNFKGSILGVSDMNLSYKSVKLKPESGDTLILFTDGIIETTDADNRNFSVKGIARAILAAGNGSAEDILNRILYDFYEFTKSDRLTDDMTIIIMKKK